MVRSANSPMAAWRAVIMRVSALREKQGLKPLICTGMLTFVLYIYIYNFGWKNSGLQPVRALRQYYLR